MFIWQSVYVQSSSPRACLYNPEHCLIMFHTELPLRFHTVFIQLPRLFLLSFGRAGPFSADWLQFVGSPNGLAWADCADLWPGRALASSWWTWIHQEEVGGCHMPFWDLLFPRLTSLCPSLCPLSDLVQWSIAEKSLFSATLLFFDSCRLNSTFQGSRDSGQKCRNAHCHLSDVSQRCLLPKWWGWIAGSRTISSQASLLPAGSAGYTRNCVKPSGDLQALLRDLITSPLAEHPETPGNLQTETSQFCEHVL